MYVDTFKQMYESNHSQIYKVTIHYLIVKYLIKFVSKTHSKQVNRSATGILWRAWTRQEIRLGFVRKGL